MKIDVKEIIKIKLEKDELLWITVDESKGVIQEEAWDEFLKIIPEDWKNRIIIGPDNIRLTKISKE